MITKISMSVCLKTLDFQCHYVCVRQFAEENPASQSLNVCVSGRHWLFRVTISVCISLLGGHWLSTRFMSESWKDTRFSGSLCLFFVSVLRRQQLFWAPMSLC